MIYQTLFYQKNNNNNRIKVSSTTIWLAVQKQSYSNTKKVSPAKNENFQIKKNVIFYISAQNIYCGYSLELPW